MILRKPYAFFIKHFKLIHVILACLVFYSIYKTKLVLDFFNEYSSIIIDVSGQDLVTPLIPFIFQLMPFLILIGCITILIVMIVKQKPCIYYLITIGVYIYTFIIIQITKSTLYDLSINLLPTQQILLIRDLIFVSFIAQIISSIMIVVRATGFDVKKFDFKTDLKELEIEEKDREEVEVQINFDSNKLVRQIRKKIRFLKYAYKENRLLFNLVISFSSIILVSLLMFLIFGGQKIINQNEYFSGNNISMKITDSYIVNTDYKGNVLNEDYYYLLLNIEAKSNYSEQSLDFATLKILIDNYIYTPTIENRDSFFDFGTVYNEEKIGTNYEEKVLLYKIPKELINKDIYFSFVDKNNKDDKGNFKNVKVKIDYENLIGIDSINTATLNNTLQLTDSILNDYKIVINAYDIQKKYKLSYNLCVSNNCYPSYEYLVPTINTNEDKAILKIMGSIEMNPKIDGVNNLYDFINKFGKLYYTVDGVKKVQNINFSQLKSKKVQQNNIYYIEVVGELEKATHISLMFTIRNKNYEYILK